VLREQELLDDAELARIEEEIATEIDDAVAYAEEAELEPVEDLERFVYAEEPS
jgi:pyruvate dehydrogenase E1 component alpha subunit